MPDEEVVREGIYLYYDRTGRLKEVINDDFLKQGGYGISKLYVYIDRADVESITASYLLRTNLIVGPMDLITETITKEIPFNQRRDLLFFKYHKDYEFFVIDLTDTDDNDHTALDEGGLVHCELTFVTGEGNLIAVGGFNFEVEPNLVLEQKEIASQEYLNLSDYQFLLKNQQIVKNEFTDFMNENIVDGTSLGLLSTVADLYDLTGDKSVLVRFPDTIGGKEFGLCLVSMYAYTGAGEGKYRVYVENSRCRYGGLTIDGTAEIVNLPELAKDISVIDLGTADNGSFDEYTLNSILKYPQGYILKQNGGCFWFKYETTTYISYANISDNIAIDNNEYVIQTPTIIIDINTGDWTKGSAWGGRLPVVSGNPVLDGTESNLTGIRIGGTKYKVADETVDQVFNSESTNAQSGVAINNEINTRLSAVYKPAGSGTIYTLNNTTKLATMDGNVYNMTDGGNLLNSDLSTTAVITGDNVVFLWNNGSWKWDALAGFVDLSGKQNTLVSGTNIKSVNGKSILGAGNLETMNLIEFPANDLTYTLDSEVLADLNLRPQDYVFKHRANYLLLNEKTLSQYIYKVVYISTENKAVAEGDIKVDFTTGVCTLSSVTSPIVEANPTIPSGATTTTLSNLKVGSDYYNIPGVEVLDLGSNTSGTLSSSDLTSLLANPQNYVLKQSSGYFWFKNTTSTNHVYAVISNSVNTLNDGYIVETPVISITDSTGAWSKTTSYGGSPIPQVVTNPTVPSGTTPTGLSNLKIGGSYYSILPDTSGLDNTKTYGLKYVNGTLTWVQEN